MDRVILVDDQDRAIGTEEKYEAHRKGLLHRAFSIVVFDADGQMLLQRRASSKYHSAGLWSNTCCSHPAPKQTPGEALHARLRYEMGFDCPLAPAFRFTYRVAFDNGLVEHEVDHVFTGIFSGQPVINPHEAAAYQWIEPPLLRQQLAQQPAQYTPWFRLICQQLYPDW